MDFEDNSCWGRAWNLLKWWKHLDCLSKANRKIIHQWGGICDVSRHFLLIIYRTINSSSWEFATEQDFGAMTTGTFYLAWLHEFEAVEWPKFGTAMQSFCWFYWFYGLIEVNLCPKNWLLVLESPGRIRGDIDIICMCFGLVCKCPVQVYICLQIYTKSVLQLPLDHLIEVLD